MPTYDGSETYTSKSPFFAFGTKASFEIDHKLNEVSKSAFNHLFENSLKYSTVENRERVKVIDGTIGVPISTQVSFKLARLLPKTFFSGPLMDIFIRFKYLNLRLCLTRKI